MARSHLDTTRKEAYYSRPYLFASDRTGVVSKRMNRICGKSSVSVCVLALTIAASGPAPAAAPPTRASPRPEPQKLWREYPLDSAQARGPTRPNGTTATTPGRRQVPSTSTEAESSGNAATVLFIALAAAILLAAAGLAAFGLRRWGPAALLNRGRVVGRAPAPWLTFRLSQGGLIMANPRRKLWARREPGAHATSEGQDSPEDGNTPSTVGRLLQQYVADNPPPAASSESAAAVEQPSADASDEAGAELPTDLSDVGAEVGAVLKSAREAAGRIRSLAQEEAAKVRDEAESDAAATLAEVRSAAEADRAEGRRLRADAEAYANETRAAADTFAEEARTQAEREAAQILDEANARLEAADAEVEKRLRKVQAKARERLEALQAGSNRYEKRLESMLVVFRGMSSQLEELLGRREGESEPEAAADETLEDALRPDSVSSSSP